MRSEPAWHSTGSRRPKTMGSPSICAGPSFSRVITARLARTVSTRVFFPIKPAIIELLSSMNSLPAQVQTPIRNNGGGVYNHELYFDSMKNPVGQEPDGILAEAIDRDFGSYKQWKEQMKQAAVSKFGSGWAWLVTDENGKLSIVQTANQDVPDLKKYTPLLLVDIWEHAYYLQYQNRRADYVEGWFDLINWRKAGKRYEDATGREKG